MRAVFLLAAARYSGTSEKKNGQRFYLAAPELLSDSNTQVSLVPPPWLLLTTKDPSFNATRVNPAWHHLHCFARQDKRTQINMPGAMPLST
jgi:hypothetical protein